MGYSLSVPFQDENSMRDALRFLRNHQESPLEVLGTQHFYERNLTEEVAYSLTEEHLQIGINYSSLEKLEMYFYSSLLSFIALKFNGSKYDTKAEESAYGFGMMEMVGDETLTEDYRHFLDHDGDGMRWCIEVEGDSPIESGSRIQCDAIGYKPFPLSGKSTYAATLLLHGLRVSTIEARMKSYLERLDKALQRELNVSTGIEP